jgi:hypothetical protein
LDVLRIVLLSDKGSFSLAISVAAEILGAIL